MWLLIVVVLTLTMPRFIYVGDPITIRATTINLLRGGSLSVSEQFALRHGERGQHFFENSRDGAWYSKYGVFNAVAYLPPLLAEWGIRGELTHYEQLANSQRALRGLLLNTWNLFIALVLAAYLFRLAALHGAGRGGAAVFVLLTFFATFLWHYLRAQTVEIFQVALFTASYYHLARFNDAVRGNSNKAALHATVATAMLGALCLSKTVYVLLPPVATAFICWQTYRATPLSTPDGAPDPLANGPVASARWRRAIRDHRAVWVGALLALAGACMLLGITNWWRFGSPWTSGYQQFAVERTLFRLAPEGFIGYMVDAQKSIFLYFPTLLLALLGITRMPRDKRLLYASACAGFLLMYVVNSCFVNWRGDWCYGPRYLLFALPVLSLPAAALLSSRWPVPLSRGVVVAGMFVFSLLTVNAPMSIHASGFFAAFRARQCFAEPGSERIVDEHVRAYFRRPHWRVNRDLQHFARGVAEFPPIEMAGDRLDEAQRDSLRQSLRQIPLGNFYWPAQLARRLESPEHTARRDEPVQR